MKHVLAALAGVLGGFLLGELVAVAIGVTVEGLLDASMPFALKLMPFYLAVAGAVAGPYLLGRRSGGPDGKRGGVR